MRRVMGSLPQMDDGSRLVAEIGCGGDAGGGAGLGLLRCSGWEDVDSGAAAGCCGVVATDVSAKRLAQTEARLRRYAYAERVVCGVADAAEIAKGS